MEVGVQRGRWMGGEITKIKNYTQFLICQSISHNALELTNVEGEKHPMLVQSIFLCSL